MDRVDVIGGAADRVTDEVRSRVAVIRRRIAEAGGEPDRVSICAVTKGFGVDAVHAALAAGLVDVGENYAQELVAKATAVSSAGPPVPVRWHMIGSVQRNKVKRLAPHVWCWQTVDRSELAAEIARHAPGARVLIQVNATAEPGKFGVGPRSVAELAAQVRELGLDLRGLMAVGPTDPDADPRPAFARVAALGAELGVDELSMGMTRDLETAVAAGATMIRVGTALFGPRPTSATVP